RDRSSGGPPAQPALGRPATARRGRPGARRGAPGHPGRRAHGQPRLPVRPGPDRADEEAQHRAGRHVRLLDPRSALARTRDADRAARRRPDRRRRPEECGVSAATRTAAWALSRAAARSIFALILPAILAALLGCPVEAAGSAAVNADVWGTV